MPRNLVLLPQSPNSNRGQDLIQTNVISQNNGQQDDNSQQLDFQNDSGEQDAASAIDNNMLSDEHEGKLQSIISKMKKSAVENQTIQKIKQEMKKEVPVKQVIRKNEVEYKVHGKKLILDKRSLFILHIKLPLRKLSILLTEWKWFDRFIIFIIFLNSLFLATYDYSDRNDTSLQNQVVEVSGRVFTAIFTAECALKIVSYGFIYHKNSYLRDGWNWLDFIVVIIGWIELLPNIPNLRGLRTLRVLRPLRSINAIPSMKNQITSLIKSLGQLVNVLLFLMFLFIIFGIFGVQIFQGQFYQRCRLTPTPDLVSGTWPIDPSIDRLCALPGSEGWYQCPETSYCGAPIQYDLSLDQENLTQAAYMNYGITTFDNLGIGMLTIFQIISLEGWSDLMYMMMDSGSPWLAGIYFILLVFLGSFFLMNIILVVIISNYSQTKDQQIKDDQHKKDQIRKEKEQKIKEEKQKLEDEMLKSKSHNLSSRKNTLQIKNEQELSKQDSNLQDLIYKHKGEGEQTLSPQSPQENNNSKNINEESKWENELSESIENSYQQNAFLPVIKQNENKFRTTFYDLDQRRIKIEDSNHQSSLDQNKDQQNKQISEKELKTELKDKDNKNEIKNNTHTDVIGPKSKDLNLQLSKFTNAISVNQKSSNVNTIFDLTEDKQSCFGNNFLLKIRYLFFIVAMNPIFATVVILLILMNTIILSLDRYPMDQETDDIYDSINTVLTWLFFAEMIIKLIGLGPKNYSRDKFNLFDAFITCLTTVENIIDLAAQGTSFSSGGAISGFRAVRLFRIFKLARQMKSFQEMLSKISMSLKDIGNFSILLFLFLFTYTLLGMEMFSYKVRYNDQGQIDLINGESPRQNFDNFLHAFVTIFIVLIGDNWNTIMYSYYNELGGVAALFFITLQIFGKYVLLNLFLAILLQNFEDNSSTSNPNQTMTNQSDISNISYISRLKEKIKEKVRGLFKKNKVNVDGQFNDNNSVQLSIQNFDSSMKGLYKAQDSARSKAGDYNDRSVSDISSFRYINNHISRQNSVNLRQSDLKTEGAPYNRQESLFNPQRQQQHNLKRYPTLAIGQGTMVDLEPVPNNGALSNYQTENDEIFGDQAFASNRQLLSNNTRSQRGTSKKRKNLFESLAPSSQNKQLSAASLKGKTFYLMSNKSSIRVFMYRIVTHKYFDPFILTMILISTILLAIDDPLDDPDGQVSDTLERIDYAITSIFCIESILKIVVYGFIINGPESYLRVTWNIMDFIIVIFSIISILLSDMNIQFIKVLRMLRVLRPLRMISRNEGLKLAVLSLINAVPSIINALVISLLFYILFGIFATNFFKGTFYYCYSDNISQFTNINFITTKWDCLNVGGEWQNQIINFDNILTSMMSLFILSTTEGWADIMYHGVDATQIDHDPVYNMNEGWLFFFMAFMIVGSLFLLNLFVSIVVNVYYIEKEKLSQNDALNKYQQQWLQIQVLCFNSYPDKKFVKNNHIIARFCQRISESPKFDYFIIGCIIVNTILMTLSWYDNPDSLNSNLEIINYIFTAIFTVEAIIKIIAYGRFYFTQGWNIFDFLIVIISYITLIIGQNSSASIGPKQTTIVRAFRIGRVFRLIKKAQFLRIIFNTIIVTLPGLANVGALMLLLLFIFAVLGVQTFASIKLQDNLNQHANFQNFGLAFLTLIRLQTGEGWNNIMEDTLRQKSVIFDCDENPTYQSIQANGGQPNGCGTTAAYAYFLAFELIVSIIFLNLFVAVILQGFSTSTEEEILDVYKKQIEAFKKIWLKFDPEGTGYIHVRDMNELIDDIEKQTDIIQTIIKGDFARRRMFISHLQIPTYNKFQHYYFQDVISCLQKKYLSHRYVIEELQSLEVDDTSSYAQRAKDMEHDFEEIIEDIEYMGDQKKIQMIEENYKHRTKYSKRQNSFVDKFEDKVYDSSYIVWVPVIQVRIKPFLTKLLEKKREELRLQALLDRNNSLSVIMETGSHPIQLQSHVLRNGMMEILDSLSDESLNQDSHRVHQLDQQQHPYRIGQQQLRSPLPGDREDQTINNNNNNTNNVSIQLLQNDWNTTNINNNNNNNNNPASSSTRRRARNTIMHQVDDVNIPVSYQQNHLDGQIAQSVVVVGLHNNYGGTGEIGGTASVEDDNNDDVEQQQQQHVVVVIPNQIITRNNNDNLQQQQQNLAHNTQDIFEQEYSRVIREEMSTSVNQNINNQRR